MNILRLVALPLALGLSLSACLDPDTITSSNPTATAALAGGVAFHLSGGDSLALVGKADSVRIEATRTGYPTHSVSGSLQGTTRLSDLEPGLWNLKIALYDANLAIRWAGDTTVNIFSGTTADAVVRLHPATGSVNVRIVLDTTGDVLTIHDTLPIDSAQLSNASNWSTTRAWRTAEGIHFFGTPYQCGMVPKVRLGSFQPMKGIAATARRSEVILDTIPLIYTIRPSPDSSMLVLDLDDMRAVSMCIAFEPAQKSQVEFFVPWTRSGPVTLHTSTGDVVLQDPGTTILPMPDSSFTSYSYSISSMSGSLGTYTLEANGKATFTPPYQIVLVDSTGITPMTPKILSDSATMHPDSLAIALSILQSNAVRHPVSLAEQQPLVSNGIEMSCPSDAGFSSRKISYANGTNADLSWSHSNFCGTLPTGWKDLNRVDNMLERLLPRVITYLDVDGSPLIAN